MNIGIFAVDPGGKTGVAWGIFDPGAPRGVRESLRNKLRAGSDTIQGDERHQISQIANSWMEFYNLCVRQGQLPPQNVWLVVENFIYTGASYSGKSAAISTSLIWGLEGYRMGRRDEWLKHKRGKSYFPQMYLQLAADAHQFGTDELLKDTGLWIPGREHERSAWRHVATFLNRYMIQKRAA
jgi:hypothetical protein